MDENSRYKLELSAERRCANKRGSSPIRCYKSHARARIGGLRMNPTSTITSIDALSPNPHWLHLSAMQLKCWRVTACIYDDTTNSSLHSPDCQITWRDLDPLSCIN
ncbi:Uncharacterized protein HZ326_22715 [Fusarium oxysporum f. sp. albedinis]|nr:Uncharacterized protein HZ326_22715 [Fusarium oxysporum f. sp. albedinis]